MIHMHPHSPHPRRSTIDTPQRFNALPREEQLKCLNCDAEMLPSREPAVSYYKLPNFYVRVTMSHDPLRVVEVEAFSG